jgi:tetratricopeptide (TPR) repeat protein
VEVARVLGRTDVLVMRLGLTFWTAVNHGTLTEARLALIEADKVAQADGRIGVRSPLDYLWAGCHVIERDLDAATLSAEAALQGALYSGDTSHLLAALVRLGDVHYLRGRTDQAQQHWQDVVRIGGTFPLGMWELQGRFRLVYADVVAGRYAAALDALDGPELQNLPGSELPAAALHLRATAHFLAGRTDESEKTVLASLEVLGSHGRPVRRAVAALTLRLIAQMRGDERTASKWAEMLSVEQDNLAPWLHAALRALERELAGGTLGTGRPDVTPGHASSMMVLCPQGGARRPST